MGVTFKVPFRDLAKFSNRTRLEFHVNEEGLSQWRARNRSKASAKVWKKNNKAVDFTLSDEFFLVTAGVNENRLRGGFDVWVTKNAGIAVYYQWQTTNSLEKDAEWIHIHGAGAAGLLKF